MPPDLPNSAMKRRAEKFIDDPATTKKQGSVNNKRIKNKAAAASKPFVPKARTKQAAEKKDEKPKTPDRSGMKTLPSEENPSKKAIITLPK